MAKSSDPQRDYAVGYGKPPEATRFKPGQSGNVRGRPKGAVNLSTILQRALRERVTILENGRRKSITKLEAAAKQLVNRAATGDYRALQMLLPQLVVVDASLTPTSLEERDRDDRAVMATLLERFSPVVEGASLPATHLTTEAPAPRPARPSRTRAIRGKRP